MANDGQSDGLVITDGMIARRAFEISLTESDATPDEIWLRAERELKQESERDQP